MNTVQRLEFGHAQEAQLVLKAFNHKSPFRPPLSCLKFAPIHTFDNYVEIHPTGVSHETSRA